MIIQRIKRQVNTSPTFETGNGWGPGFAKAFGHGPGVVVGPGADNPNVFAQQFFTRPNEQFKIVARASSVDKPKAMGRFQINWTGSGKYITTSFKPFEVTPHEQTFETYVVAPDGAETGTLYVVGDGHEDVVRYTEMRLLGVEETENSISAADALFPSSAIHLLDPETQRKYSSLFRGYDHELQYKDMIRKVMSHTMVTYDGLCVLLDIVRHCESQKIAGDYVEVGCWRGGCAGLMAQGSMQFGSANRMIHVFDSFVGLPQPMASKDFDGLVEKQYHLTKEMAQGKLEPINALVASEEELLELLLRQLKWPANMLTIHKGWFQDTIPSAAKVIDKISLLRLDGDLYDSYKVSLEHLYPKVIQGGFVIIDDWCFEGCRTAVREYFDALDIHPFVWTMDVTTRCFMKP